MMQIKNLSKFKLNHYHATKMQQFNLALQHFVMEVFIPCFLTFLISFENTMSMLNYCGGTIMQWGSFCLVTTGKYLKKTCQRL